MSLKLITSSYWHFNNQKFAGDLYLNQDNGTILLYLRVPSTKIESYFLFPQNISYINSTSLTGTPITLLDLHRISTNTYYGSENTYGYEASILIQGVGFNSIEEVTFKEMTFRIPGILKWGGKSVFTYPTENHSKSVMDYNLFSEYDIYENNEYKLIYSIGSKFPFTDFKQEEMIFYQYPSIQIHSKESHDYKWFFNIATKFKKLVEIAVGTPLSFDKVFTTHPKLTIDSPDTQPILLDIELIHNMKNPEFINTRKDIHYIEFLFTLDDLLNHLDKNLWEIAYDKLNPIFELYIEDLYNPYPSIHQKFLNIIQALETLHARFIFQGSVKKFEERVEEIIKNRPEIYKESDRRFLLGPSKPKNIYLSCRIADLILADFEYIFHLGNFQEEEFPQLIAKTRNYYIHYDPKLENQVLYGERLYEAYLVLKNILEYYLLKIIGFNQEYIFEKMKHRNRHLINYLSILDTDNNIFNK
ncbi:HEPN domain-containing protein [Heyndrickxia oleronia]|uniref:ApeA N-terminal domain 1-containing protein n=1 Tax=Heyndrickxia oleronia TaxID=38875 RepID=UPI0037500B6C